MSQKQFDLIEYEAMSPKPKLVTRRGDEATILSTKAKGRYPIVVDIVKKLDNGLTQVGIVRTYAPDGKRYNTEPSAYDLMMEMPYEPAKQEVYDYAKEAGNVYALLAYNPYSFCAENLAATKLITFALKREHDLKETIKQLSK